VSEESQEREEGHVEPWGAFVDAALSNLARSFAEDEALLVLRTRRTNQGDGLILVRQIQVDEVPAVLVASAEGSGIRPFIDAVERMTTRQQRLEGPAAAEPARPGKAGSAGQRRRARATALGRVAR
jgi:hypothetical protein